MNSWIIIQTIINGILSGGVYSMVAVGITIIFGVMKMVNFAAGAYLVWGMYFTWLLHTATGWSAYVLAPLVILAMLLFGYISFKSTIRQVLDIGGTSFILITVGLSFFLQNLAETIFGTSPKTVESAIKLASIKLGRFTIGYPRLIAFIVMVAVVIGVNILLSKTLLGRAMRATAEKPEVAQMLGINTERTYTIAFLIGVSMAALSGLLVTPLFYVTATAGNAFRIAPLMVVVLGGLGSIKGAFVGGLMVGVVEALVTTLIAADLGTAAICILFLIILYLKPYGIFGKGARTA